MYPTSWGKTNISMLKIMKTTAKAGFDKVTPNLLKLLSTVSVKTYPYSYDTIQTNISLIKKTPVFPIVVHMSLHEHNTTNKNKLKLKH